MNRLELFTDLLRNRTAALGLCLIAGIVAVALAGPALAPYDPLVPAPLDRLQPPSAQHLFGTDSLGRDILSRVIHGSRLSLLIGIISVTISLVPGTVLGLLAGYFGDPLDSIIMRVMDVLLAFPAVLLAIFITAILGPSLPNTMIAVGIVYIPHYARIVRSNVLSLKQQLFVQAIRHLGGSHARVILLHILPNTFAPIIVYATLGMGTAVLQAAALGFLGLGAQPPQPEWGAMLSEGRQYIQMAPHVAGFPGLAILLLVLGFNLFGDGLRDVLDPSLRSR
ncbi:peptide/nickel transport system permease protein [Desulfacinum infernum DSM 9756]|jgi:peptide/nickel transport system permease protein|uniref:Peptide/nickel transport system permease protein n=1 Tax=Desulfacinum infernum DSM 9756 TaxID=1121391 RepID=A0A1M4YGS1_9BACT|nr:ABC transporter permease [Desulfacinum infernum]MBC7358632.1 ABC transporter permease [Desulfacinum sp.]MBZ4659687.1 binding-protein-dependent transport system inner rane component [Desulfacinum sp.]SHF04930.1 peptide/nickel transport system permease protein [Desulfacinum infernum DSM 9756]